MNNSAKQYFSSNAVSSIIRIGASSIATIILVPFMIKNIGIERYSYISITTFIVSFSSFFDLGLSKSLVYVVNDPSIDICERDRVITFQRIVNIVTCCLVLFFGFVAIICGWEVFGKSLSSSDPLYALTTSSGVILLVLALFNQYQASLLEAFYLLDKVNNGITIKIMALNVLYFIILVSVNSIVLYILSAVLASCICTLYYNYCIKSNISMKWIKPDKNTTNKCVAECWNYCRLGVCTSIYSALPKLSVMYMSSSIVLIGILDVINKITMSIVNLCASIMKPLFALSRSMASVVSKNLKHITSINAGVSVIFVLMILILSKWITAFFFHDPSIDGAYIQRNLIVFSIATAFMTCGQPLSMFLMGIGKTKKLIAIITINILLFSISYCVLNIVMGLDVLYSLGISNIVVALFYFINLIVISYESIV